MNKHRAFVAANRHRYDGLLAKQSGGCGICGRPPTDRRLDMDHDHKTMTLRGLLCNRCNRFLMPFMTKTWLEAAARYVGG